ncbi:MAG: cytochrome c oxidase assembly protein [Actinomycetota bacterium]
MVIFHSWTWDPVVIAGLAGAITWYGWALGRLREEGARWPIRRTWLFRTGVAVLVIALVSPVDAYAERLLSVHMVQHLLLTLLAPPLLLLGSPVTLAVRSAGPAGRLRALSWLHGRMARFISAPAIGWALFVGTIYASHLPAFYDASLRSSAVHAGEHLAYVATALLFWRPIVARDPEPVRLSHPARLFSLFLLMPAMTFLGLAIYGSERVLYLPYVATSRAAGTSAVSDQHLAGALMWSAGMLFIVPAMVVVLIDWMRTDEREAERTDARLDKARASEGRPAPLG